MKPRHLSPPVRRRKPPYGGLCIRSTPDQVTGTDSLRPRELSTMQPRPISEIVAREALTPFQEKKLRFLIMRDGLNDPRGEVSESNYHVYDDARLAAAIERIKSS